MKNKKKPLNDTKNYITLFMDDELTPMGTFETPAVFELDTTNLRPGEHQLKLVNSKAKRKKVRILPFVAEQDPVIIYIGSKKRQILSRPTHVKSRPQKREENIQQLSEQS